MYIDVNGITFWATNIPNEVERIINIANKNMDETFDNDEQRQAYNLGVQNTLSALKSLLDGCVDRESITFYYPDTETSKEMLFEEIIEWLDSLN